jgi:hypothetical protein
MAGMRSGWAFIVLAAALCLLISLDLAAQQLPRLQEDNLAGQKVDLPDAASGKVAVLVFGFTHASQTTTEAWVKRIQADFSKTSGFELYQLPVLEDAPRFIRGMVVSGMKKGVAENLRANFIPVLHDEAELKKLVGYSEKDDAYMVVLDRGGKVAYQAHSATPDQGYAQLQAKVESLLK